MCVGLNVCDDSERYFQQSLLCRFVIVPGSCLLLCTINSIICTWTSQPASPWAIVFPSGVSAHGTTCHTSRLAMVRTGLARPRWGVMAFEHRPLQQGREVDRRRIEGLTAEELCLLFIHSSSSGVSKGGESDERMPLEATSLCPEQPAPSGHTAERGPHLSQALENQYFWMEP